MTIVSRSRRLACLLAALLAMAAPVFARHHRTEAWARQQFSTAERLREALNGRPVKDRSRREYQRVLDSYRRVYYGAPASVKAEPSVVAVAELLVEVGRQFDDAKLLRSAIGQYKFLRREYPGSKYRVDALFTIGQIYRDDLNDSAKARETFQDFLRRYPRSHLVEQARKELADPVVMAADRKVISKSIPGKGDAKPQPKPDTLKSDTLKADSKASSDVEDEYDSAAGDKSAEFTLIDSKGHLPRVTGIRHWSTPNYTRVAIDLEQSVKFESQRIDSPDRVFFDLRGTRLASTLVGKTLEVDDGFLKKVRVAQFKADRTRVVLEVDSLSEYEAFLLPNPYRLIIDIHGKDIHGKDIHGKDIHGKTPQGREVQETQAAKVKSTSDVTEAEVRAPDTVTTTKPVLPAIKAVPPVITDAATVPNAKKLSEKLSEKKAEARVDEPKATAKSGAQPTRKIVEADSNSSDHNDSSDDENSASKTAKNDAPSALKVSAKASGKPSSKNLHDTAGSSDADKISDVSSSQDSAIVAQDTSAKSSEKRSKASKKESIKTAEVREARPTADGDRSLIRALGLKIGKIVIDAGHGGHDTGTIGPHNVREKDVVLDVGRRLGKLLQQRLGSDVIYTRQDDTFIPLETRTAIANREQADLFVSIHANSSDDPDARGVETYYLNFTSSKDALEVAARENAVSDKSIHELQDLVKKIALKEKIEESREFATDVQTALHGGLATKGSDIRNRGVKKAPFIVLIGANMPSILAEISFVSNPTDARKLQTPEYRQRIAESLYRGIARYVNGLSGVKVASRMSHIDGQ